MTIITDRQGNTFEVVRGEVPPKPFDIGRGEPAKQLAALIEQRTKNDKTKCEHQHQREIYTELGVPDVLVHTDDGDARVYANKGGVLVMALERPSAAFYAAQRDSAQSALTSAQGALTEAQAAYAELDAELTAAEGSALKDFIRGGKPAKLDEAEKAVAYWQAQVEQNQAALDWNTKAAATRTSLGDACVCAVKAAIAKVR